MSKPIDKRGVLDEEVFSCKITKGQKVLIYHQGKLVMTLKDKRAEKFISAMQGKDGKDAQLVMAKITGQFKYGNER